MKLGLTKMMPDYDLPPCKVKSGLSGINFHKIITRITSRASRLPLRKQTCGTTLTRSNEDKIIPGEWMVFSGCKRPEGTNA